MMQSETRWVGSASKQMQTGYGHRQQLVVQNHSRNEARLIGRVKCVAQRVAVQQTRIYNLTRYCGTDPCNARLKKIRLLFTCCRQSGYGGSACVWL